MRTPGWAEIAIGLAAVAGILANWVSGTLTGENGGVLGAGLHLFGYFTIWTNTLVAVLYLAHARGGFARGAATTFTAMVGLVYHFQLAHLDVIDTSWRAVGNALVHYIVPAAVALDWLAFGPRAGLRWRWAATWLAFPFAYTVFAVGLGTLRGSYAYPFLDLGTLGPAGLLREVLVLIVAFLLFGLLVIGVRKLFDRRPTALGAS